MKRLKELYPNRVTNVSVGPDIHDKAVDITFQGPLETQRFIKKLHALAA